MKPLILIDEAEADVSDAYGFYLPRREGLADRFLAAIREALVRVQENPGAFPRVNQTVRRARILGFPHSVYFREDPELIAVLAVFHGRRHAEEWSEDHCAHAGIPTPRCVGVRGSCRELRRVLAQ